MGRRYNPYVRREPYKEDSTKGKSLMNPQTYKGDVLVQVWLDSRMLATLSSWLDDEGNYTRFMSDVVRVPLTILCDHLVDGGKAVMVEDTSTARDVLESKYRVNLNPNGRGGANKLHNQILSERRKGLGEIDSRTSMHNKHSVQTPEFSEPVVVDTSSKEVFDDMWERAQKKIKEEEVKEKAEKVPDTSAIVPQIMSAGLNQELYNKLMAEPVMESRTVKKSDAPRVKTEEENEREALELEKSDRVELEKLKNM